MQGSVVEPESGRRAARVNVQGIDDEFAAFFPGSEEALDLSRREGQLFASLAVNRSLAEALAVEPGDSVVLYLERPSEAPRASLMGEKDPEDQLESVRLSVVSVLDDAGPGSFGLAPHQSQPLVGYARLRDLQRELDRRGLANALLVGERAGAGDGTVAEAEAGTGGSAADGEAAALDLERRIRSHARAADFSLEFVEAEDHLRVATSQIVFGEELAAAVEALAAAAGVEALGISTYLANRAAAEGGSAAPYSTIAALDTGRAGELGVLRLADGRPAPALGPGEVLVNTFLADDLGVGEGDRLAIDYFVVGDREQLVERTVRTTVAGVVEMAGWAADRDLTPDFPGVADADNMSDWDPTFPVDLGRIRDLDEAYWDEHRGTPKLFVDLDYGAELWSSRFGLFTSLRLLPAEGSDPARLRAALEAEAPAGIALHAAGLAVEPVKAAGLRGATGATDFGGLFIGFSLFLIVSAALLVGLFFRLGTESRANEMGLLLALGHGVKRVRRRFLLEGALLGGAGVLLGLGGAVLYAGAMMAALRTLWRSAVGSSQLYLHVEPLTLVLGGAGSLLVVLFAVRGAVGRLAAVSPIRLLRGETVEQPASAVGPQTRASRAGRQRHGGRRGPGRRGRARPAGGAARAARGGRGHGGRASSPAAWRSCCSAVRPPRRRRRPPISSSGAAPACSSPGWPRSRCGCGAGRRRRCAAGRGAPGRAWRRRTRRSTRAGVCSAPRWWPARRSSSWPWAPTVSGSARRPGTWTRAPAASTWSPSPTSPSSPTWPAWRAATTWVSGGRRPSLSARARWSPSGRCPATTSVA